MKSSSKQVVCTLVFFFSCIFAVSGQTEMKTRAEQPAVDATVKVHRAPGVRAPGIKGCLPSPVSSYNVRLQSLTTSGGSVYTRQLVTTAGLPCFENSGTKATLGATNIANCAEATAKKGLNSFSWENGACTAYLAWRPQKRADCKDGGSKVVYVVKKPLTPFDGGKIIVSGKIKYDALPLVFLSISHQYDSCGVNSRIHKGYKLQINGSGVVMLPEGNVKYSLSRKLLCSGSMNFSFWSVGADGNVNSNESQVTYAGSSSSHYYGLQTGGCIYDAKLMDGYSGSLQYCNSTANGTLYYAEVAGGAKAFLAAMALTGYPVPTDGFYVGLKWVAIDQWEWLGGLAQSNNDTVWAFIITGAASFEWAVAYTFDDKWYFQPIYNSADSYPVVCYFPNP